MQPNLMPSSDVFFRFTSFFEAYLQNQLRKFAIEVSEDVDQNISQLGQASAQSLKEALVAACINTIGQRIPENRLGDRVYAYMKFVLNHHRTPKEGLSFNDVLYRIKTTDEILDPLRVFISDKEFLKLYVKAVVGDQYNVPVIDVLRKVEEVDAYAFPPDCCIKPTHASGQVILRKNGEILSRERIKNWFYLNHYRVGREANYKTLKPKVIIEPLVFDNTNAEDYRFFCLNGAPKLILVDLDVRLDRRRLLFDTSWNQFDFSLGYPKSDRRLDRPDNLDEMIDVAAKLSNRLGFVRVDFYSDGKTCFIGEITNCHARANQRFIPPSAEAIASKFVFD